MRLRLSILLVFVVALIVGALDVRPSAQPPFLVYGSGSGAAQVIKATSNALWVSIQSMSGIITTTVDGIATTSTDGHVLQNTTAATSGVTVQYSPRLRFSGTAWNTASSETNDWEIHNEPTSAATPGSSLQFKWSRNGGAYTIPVSFADTGSITGTGTLTMTNGVAVSSMGSFVVSTRGILQSGGNGSWSLYNTSGSFGVQINEGSATPTLTSCGTGSLTTKSNNSTGGFTATGATSCTVTFGAPAWTNNPFCTLTEMTTAGPYRISAISTTAFTVTGFTSGDQFMYNCFGGL